MLVDIIKMFILQWLATDNDQQSYPTFNLRKRLNACVLADGGHFEPINANWIVALNMA